MLSISLLGIRIEAREEIVEVSLLLTAAFFSISLFLFLLGCIVGTRCRFRVIAFRSKEFTPLLHHLRVFYSLPLLHVVVEYKERHERKKKKIEGTRKKFFHNPNWSTRFQRMNILNAMDIFR